MVNGIPEPKKGPLTPRRLTMVLSTLKMLGPWETFKGVVHHLSQPAKEREGLRFDGEHGTDTNASMEVHDLGIGVEERSSAILYYPLEPRVFRFILNSLKIDYSEFVFVDIGSGKGRNLLLTWDYPFRRRIGVEISPLLHRIAKQNIDIFSARRGSDLTVELRNENALDFSFPEEDTVIFMYHPFTSDVLLAFLGNLEQSLKERPRRILLVTVCPRRSRAVLRECSFLEPEIDFRVMRDDWCWCLHKNKASTAQTPASVSVEGRVATVTER